MIIEGFKKIIFAALMIFGMLIGTTSAFCTPIKIHNLIFDNSDNIILIKSTGEIKTQNTQDVTPLIKKGVLSAPERVYFDITDAILTCPSKTWNVKNSTIEEIKISQFSTNPSVVRLVIKYGKNQDSAKFEIVKNFDQLILKYSNENFAQSPLYETIYRNFEDKNTAIYEPTRAEIAPEPLKQDIASTNTTGSIQGNSLDKIFEKNSNDLIQKEYKLNSKFFASKVVNAGNGLMVSGVGNISLKPTITLNEPTRLVFDISNAVLAQNLRNRTFIFSNQTTQNPAQIEARDILRLGQFDKNTVRIVIQGTGAKDYRAAISPDLQNLFIAKRQTILSSKLTQILAKVENVNFQNTDETLSTLNLNFTSPVAFSIFEEASQLHLDMQNVSEFNKNFFDQIIQNPKFTNVKLTKIASDKVRLSFPLRENMNVNSQISADGKAFRVYFKEIPQPVIVEKPKPPVIEKPDPNVIVGVPIKPAVISNYYKVVLDPGHGGSDTGAIRGGVNEKDINLAVAKIVQKNLAKQKVNVEMTMDSDKTVSLAGRVDFSEGVSPDVFVSIHSNASVRDDIVGIETHWWREDSVDLAKKVHAALANDKNIEKWKSKNRGLVKSQFYVINHTSMPAILVEIGFMSNPEELKNLTDKKWQEEAGKAIADGIMSYLKAKGK